jgi:hypothetical protein
MAKELMRELQELCLSDEKLYGDDLRRFNFLWSMKEKYESI